MLYWILYLSVVLKFDFTLNKFILIYPHYVCDHIFISCVMTATFISFIFSQLCQALIIIQVVTSSTARSDLSILINFSVGHNFNLPIPRGNFFTYS